MPNNTALIFGQVTLNGSPLGDCEVSLNWINCDGQVSIGGDDDLKTFVPKVRTNGSGRYNLPFFWDSTNGNVLGSSPVVASVLAIKFYGDGSHLALNKRGRLFLTLDMRKLIAVGYPTFPGSAPELVNIGKDFYASYRDILKAHQVFPTVMPFSTEVQGLAGELDINLTT